MRRSTSVTNTLWPAATALLAALLLTLWPPVQAAGADSAAALQRAADAVVGVRTQAVDDARSNRTLGPARQGSGVVIGDDGLVLTIGYLILEADQVQLITDDGRAWPARVVGYDVATGFGLLQSLVPMKVQPAPVGQAARLNEREALMVVNGPSDSSSGNVGMTALQAQRAFSGYWEYHLDNALYTSPPIAQHSGAGLFNSRGELVGIGSLFLTDVRDVRAERTRGQTRQPGNLFVPVDAVPALLGELRRTGTTSASRRAWLGVNCGERDGELRVLRVTDDSPADDAGLQPGDIIQRIDGTEVHALEALWKALWRGGRAERDIRLDIERDGARRSVVVHAVDRMSTLRRARGI